MKNTSLILVAFATFALLGVAVSSAQARTDFHLGLNFAPAPVYVGNPVYVQPAVVSAPSYPAWYYTPVTTVYVHGNAHYMHYYAGQWFDESTLVIQQPVQVVSQPVYRPYYGGGIVSIGGGYGWGRGGYRHGRW